MRVLIHEYSIPLWWLNLCVNLAGLRDAQIVGKTFFLGVSVKAVRKRLASESVNQERDPALPVWAGSIQSIEGTENRKVEEGLFDRILYLFLSWSFHLTLLLVLGAPGSQAFILWTLHPAHTPFCTLSPIVNPLDLIWTKSYHWLSWFSSLSIAYFGTSQLPKLHELIPVINYLLYLSMYPISSVSLKDSN